MNYRILFVHTKAPSALAFVVRTGRKNCVSSVSTVEIVELLAADVVCPDGSTDEHDVVLI